MSERPATFLDANAGVPLRDEVKAALLSFLGGPAGPSSDQTAGLGGSAVFFTVGNPSSTHATGRQARKLLTRAREQVAASLGTRPLERVTFVSSGTEAAQLAIRSELEPWLDRGEKAHWILTPVEHDAVLQMVPWLEARGGSVSWLPVDADGRPRAEALASLWRPETRLFSAIWAHNETGVVSDAEALVAETRRLGGRIHLDGAQAWGKLPVELDRLGAHRVSFSGHKIGAPAGTGVLWSTVGSGFSPAIRGKQERGHRGGTENLLGIVALGAAAEVVDPASWSARVMPSRDRLERELRARLPGLRINGAGAPRVANTSSLTFPGVERPGLVEALDLAGFQVSSGSACSSGVAEPSRTLQALGLSESQARSSIRVSLAAALEPEAMEGFLDALSRAVLQQQRERHAVQG